MDVALIEMPAEVAEEQLKSYRRALHRRADAEYEVIARGLDELARMGFLTIEEGRDERSRPRKEYHAVKDMKVNIREAR
jgi:hypothetical protein